MNAREALDRAPELCRFAGFDTNDFPARSFPEYAQQVSAVVKTLTQSQRDEIPDLKDWAIAWKKLYDDFDAIVIKDPMVLYRPAHKVAQQFHESTAFVRYFRAGNRTSKTTCGYAEHYFITTGQHKWRKFVHPRIQKVCTFLIGLAYTKYAPGVFEAKMVKGEPGNSLSPMFPPGGKWFNGYNEKTKTLTIACPDCAENGKAGTCKHTKSEIRLFSDEGGWEVLQGAQYTMGHFDEHVPEEFYNEAKMRLSVISGTSLIVTGTPLHGTEAWEQKRLASLWETGRPQNSSVPENSKSPLIVSLHEISQFDAGIVNHDTIRRNMVDMDEFEIESRIYGRPAPLAKNPVFDRHALADMRKKARQPRQGVLVVTDDIVLSEQELKPYQLDFREKSDGPYRIWQEPVASSQYIIGVDTAKGLTSGDASAATVIKVEKRGTKLFLTMVAQYHGWINPLDYATEVYKLAVFYNSALVAVELTGGYGEAVMLRMRQEYAYWNIFRDESSHAAAKYQQAHRLGIETSATSKPFMVASLQQFVREGNIDIPCAATISEMVAFEQERTESGYYVRYRGASGAHDDRVMSVVIATSVAVSSPLAFDHQMAASERLPLKEAYKGQWLDLHKEMKETGDSAYDSY